MRMFARALAIALAATSLSGCAISERPTVMSNTSPANPQAPEAPLPAVSATLAPGDPLLSAPDAAAPTTQGAGAAPMGHAGHVHGRAP